MLLLVVVLRLLPRLLLRSRSPPLIQRCSLAVLHLSKLLLLLLTVSLLLLLLVLSLLLLLQMLLGSGLVRRLLLLPSRGCELLPRPPLLLELFLLLLLTLRRTLSQA